MTSADFIQKAMAPRVELKSAFGAMAIWLPGSAGENCMTPVRPATDAAQVASRFVPGCLEPGAVSTMISFTGTASKLYRATKLAASEGRALMVRIAGALVIAPKLALLATIV